MEKLHWPTEGVTAQANYPVIFQQTDLVEYTSMIKKEKNIELFCLCCFKSPFQTKISKGIQIKLLVRQKLP